MGGSGGVFTGRDIDDLREEARRRLEESQNESGVNSLLQQELTSLNDRDANLINGHLDTIQETLSERGHEVERLRFGGSVAKHTYVDGLSDVDSLVLLEGDSLGEQSPEEVRRDFAETLRRALPQGNVKEIREGALAVTIEYQDGTEIQLLPAVRTADGIAISSPDGKSWSFTHPQAFAQTLTETNQAQGGRVVPAIKLAKAIFANKLGEGAVSGYHVEALAIEAFRSYSGPRTPKAMLTHLVQHASQRVLGPIPDVTGQSRNVDEYLGQSNSVPRQSLSRNLAALADTMEKTRSLDDWRDLLG